MRNQTTLTLLVVLTLSFGLDAHARKKEDMSGVIKEEFRKARVELAAELANAKKSVTSLDKRRDEVVQEAKEFAETQKTWVKDLEKYDILIQARYSDDRGDYQPGKQLSQHDVDVMNKIFQGYLNQTPLEGRISAREARVTISRGIDEIERQIGLNQSPTEKNNPELQIIAKDKFDAEFTIKRVERLAELLGFNLNQPVVAENAEAGGRKPASKKK